MGCCTSKSSAENSSYTAEDISPEDFHLPSNSNSSNQDGTSSEGNSSQREQKVITVVDNVTCDSDRVPTEDISQDPMLIQAFLENTFSYRDLAQLMSQMNSQND